MHDDGVNKDNDRAQAADHVWEDEEAGVELTWMSEDCPPETAAQFWLSVAAYEQAPWTTHFQELVDAGVELPAPESMDDLQLAAKLSEVINALARMRVFLRQTDLLSGGGEEDTRLYMKYYADEEARRHWLADFPDDGMPPHEEPPYDRDRHLPQAR